MSIECNLGSTGIEMNTFCSVGVVYQNYGKQLPSIHCYIISW